MLVETKFKRVLFAKVGKDFIFNLSSVDAPNQHFGEASVWTCTTCCYSCCQTSWSRPGGDTAVGCDYAHVQAIFVRGGQVWMKTNVWNNNNGFARAQMLDFWLSLNRFFRTSDLRSTNESNLLLTGPHDNYLCAHLLLTGRVGSTVASVLLPHLFSHVFPRSKSPTFPRPASAAVHGFPPGTTRAHGSPDGERGFPAWAVAPFCYGLPTRPQLRFTVLWRICPPHSSPRWFALLCSILQSIFLKATMDLHDGLEVYDRSSRVWIWVGPSVD
jgi:hypothetical protein